MIRFSRRAGETVVIDGGRIVVHVTEVRGQYVRLGIEAPRSIVVDRGEVHAAKLARGQAEGEGGGRP